MKSKIMGQIQVVIKAILSDKKLISHGLLLLALHLLGFLFLYDVVPEFDLVTHFLFGFVLSECISKGAYSLASHESLTRKKLHKYKWIREYRGHIDLLTRFLGFLLIGALFWESAEFFLSPLIGRSADPFFTLPISLYNIDGALDVTTGAIGTVVAWYKDEKSPE